MKVSPWIWIIFWMWCYFESEDFRHQENSIRATGLETSQEQSRGKDKGVVQSKDALIILKRLYLP